MDEHRKRVIKIKTKNTKKKYPSAEFLYSVALEDYKCVLSNYDRIYDRINIALTLCGVILVFFISNFDVSVLYKLDTLSCIHKICTIIYLLFSGTSVVLITISVIKLLLISRSDKLRVFDSNSIKDESLYSEKTEDSSLWVTLQYIRCVNDIREKTQKKQQKFTISIILLIISIVSYVVSIIVKNGGQI